jgi:pyruvate formate lyase activating enzyme
MEGSVFNIQKYSVHDGPGIRTIIFLKGCPLACRWCSNPESQSSAPELAYNANKCLSVPGCRRCLDACPAGAISRDGNGAVSIDRARCQGDMACTLACPSQALITYGKRTSVDQALRVVEQDGLFYARSGGGLTLSGGEPLAQPEFTLALLREARRRRIDTAVETCGLVQEQTLLEACSLLGALMYDIKSLNDAKHREFTGVSNERILGNLLAARKAFPELPILVRTPLVPGFNDTEEDVTAIAKFLREVPGLRHELLAYHRLGQQKYVFLGREYPMGTQALPADKAAHLVKLGEAVTRGAC